MKNLALFVLAALLSISGRAQTTAAAYNFTATTGTFSSISAIGTIPAASSSPFTISTDDKTTTITSLPFSFTYCGVVYSSFTACSNGWFSFSNSTATTFSNLLSNVSTIGPAVLMPYWDDLTGASGTAYYATTGVSPNRVFTFEWNNWKELSYVGTASFQVKLYETTNAIEFCYGSGSFGGGSATIGIANSSTDYKTLPNSTSSPTPSTTTFTTSISSLPAANQIYRWFPCPVTATATASAAVCPGGTVTLTGTSTGTSYTWAGPGGYSSTQLSPVINNVAASAAGIYTLTATDGTCNTSTTTTVSLLSAPTAPVVTPASAIICDGMTQALSATLPPSAISLVPFQGWETGVPTTAGTPVNGWNTTATSTAYITQATSGSFPSATPHTGSYMADFHSFSYSTINVSLISPSFSMTGISGGQISFWMYRDNGYNTSSYNTEGITVYVNTSASTTGATNLCFIPRRIGLAPTGTVTGTATPSGNGWYQYTVSIPATYTTGANYVLFNFNSNFGNDIYLDDVSITGNQNIAPPVWTPTTYLYNSAAATTAYTAGDTLLNVYVHPTGITAPTVVNYIATITNGVCTASDTAVVTLNPPVGAITGSTDVCISTNVTLSNATAGGVWSSSNTTVATVDPSTGVVHGITNGVDTIYYTAPGGCVVSAVVTVSNSTTPTVGNTMLCNGGFTSSLSNPTGGGTWSSSSAAVAAVSSTGVVTSGTAGNAVITYTAPSGCTDTTLITVTPPPPAITGSPNVCYNGGVTTLANAVSGGTWTTSDPALASVNSSSGVVTGLAAGSATITYTSLPGCFATLPLNLLSNPAPITGSGEVCEAGSVTTLSSTTPGGTWSTSATGVASVNASTGAVTGLEYGSAIITYTAPNNCYVTTPVVVNPLPSPITGTFRLCETNVTSLASASTGGTWTSGNLAVATVNTTTGTVGGVDGGSAAITYTLPTGCKVSTVVTVNDIPAAITGNNFVCNGYISTLSDATTGGTWSSSNSATIGVDSTTGVITGNTVGGATITYTTGPGSCYAAKAVTVSPIAPPTVSISVNPGTTVCAGTTVTFTSSVTGGGTSPIYVWSVNNVILSGAVNYSYVPANGDLVRLWVYSSYQCAVPDTSSAAVVMTVNPIVTPAVSIATGMGDTVCEETMVTLTPAPVGGGATPAYQWSVNGVSAGVSPTYTYIPHNGDVVNVVMTSVAPCRTANTATATKILTVSPFVTPAVTFSSSLGPVSCEGYPQVFTAIQVNGGTMPTYQWTVNGSPTFAAGSGSTFSYAPANGDVVGVTLTSNFPCVTTSTATANTTLTVLPVVAPVGNVYAVPGYIVAPGMYDTFYCDIISGGGSAPTYQWIVNGVPVAGATTNVYITNVLNTGDSVTCLVTNTDECSGISTFNYVTITVGTNVGVNTVSLNAADITLVPNPNSGNFAVKGTVGNATAELTLEVTDMLGKVLYRNAVTARGGQLNEQVTLNSDLANGMYLLTLRGNGVNQAVHFSVQK